MESTLAAAQDMAGQPQNIYGLLNNADMRFANAVDSNGVEHEVTHGSFIPRMDSKDRALRKSAF